MLRESVTLTLSHGALSTSHILRDQTFVKTPHHFLELGRGFIFIAEAIVRQAGEFKQKFDSLIVPAAILNQARDQIGRMVEYFLLRESARFVATHRTTVGCTLAGAPVCAR